MVWLLMRYTSMSTLSIISRVRSFKEDCWDNGQNQCKTGKSHVKPVDSNVGYFILKHIRSYIFNCQRCENVVYKQVGWLGWSKLQLIDHYLRFCSPKSETLLCSHMILFEMYDWLYDSYMHGMSTTTFVFTMFNWLCPWWISL